MLSVLSILNELEKFCKLSNRLDPWKRVTDTGSRPVEVRLVCDYGEQPSMINEDNLKVSIGFLTPKLKGR